MKRRATLAAFGTDVNGFAVSLFRLFRHLTPQDENLFCSPFSIRAALALVYAGARGNTAIEMRRALSISTNDESFHENYQAIAGQLTQERAPNTEMILANSAWVDASLGLLPAFVQVITQHHVAALESVDFSDSVGARTRINAWASDRTRGRIIDLIEPPGPPPDTQLVLANAVYFKAPWASPFDRDRTRDAPFFTDRGDAVTVPLMHGRSHVRYRKGAGYQSVVLPYRGNRLGMLVLLPDRNDGLPGLEAMLSVQMIHESLGVGSREVELFLPRFKINWGTVDLANPLREIGMRSAFIEGEADLSGIDGREPEQGDSIYISRVLHKAFVDVNEEGTEASAATAVAVARLGLSHGEDPPPVFRADHPFVFAICHGDSGAILFLGRVVNPERTAP